MAGSFSWKFDSFSPIAKPSNPHIQDKAAETARNSHILRSDCLREFRPFPINKDTTPHLKADGNLFHSQQEARAEAKGEIAETVAVALIMGGGPAQWPGRYAFKVLDELEGEKEAEPESVK